MRIPLSSIRAKIPHRPPGYYQDVTSRGILTEDTLELDDAVYGELCAKYNPDPPGLVEMAGNFVGAMASWLAAGFPIVDEATYKSRAGTCGGCEHVKDNGGCAVCGCRSIKLWLATSQCPDNPPRWLRMQ